jgi:tetratricopeptide (TPR) repeat protein
VLSKWRCDYRSNNLKASSLDRGEAGFIEETVIFSRHRCLSVLSFMLLLWVLGIAPIPLWAQAGTAVTPKKEPTLSDLFIEVRKIMQTKDPEEQATALIALAKNHPELVRVDGGSGNMAYIANIYVKASVKSPVKLETWLNIFVPAVQRDLIGTGYASSDFNYRMAKNLLDSHVLLPQALQLAQQAAEDFGEKDVFAHESYLHDERLRLAHSNYKTGKDSFDRSDALDHYQRDAAARYSLLGDLQVEAGQTAAALASYEKALKLSPNMGAYLGEAKLKESLGDKADALALLFDAELTGHLQANSIEHMKQLYVELHPGGTEAQMSAALDTLYSKRFQSPVRFTQYKPASTAPSHAILGELFTGAGCEPCVSPDLAFDAALKRYSRDEFVLLVYHDNSPAVDPLANPVTDERGKYYATGGSTPHAQLDGKLLDLVQGLPSHAQESADKIFAEIDEQISKPVDTSVVLNATYHGDNVDVTAHVQGPPNSKSRRLHLDLVEKEVSYSGENSLRINPMVVRATAQQTESESGFVIPANGVFDIHYTFEISKIEAANNAYYGHVDESLRKRSNGAIGAEYREKKVVLDPAQLAVAAFIQDDSDKTVHGAAYAEVHGDGLVSTGER